MAVVMRRLPLGDAPLLSRRYRASFMGPCLPLLLRGQNLALLSRGQ
jgi:hypothetical protein